MSNNKNGVLASQQLGASFTGRPTQGMLYQQDQVIRQKSEYASLFGYEYEDVIIPTLVDFFDGVIGLAYGVQDFALGVGLNFRELTGDLLGIEDPFDIAFSGVEGQQRFFNMYNELTGRNDVDALRKSVQDYTSTTYTDGFGNPLDVATLINKGEYLYAGEAAINSAAQSAPSLVLALINPLAGAVVAGTSTTGAKYAEDIFKRTDQTRKDIIFNSLLAGGSEMLTEYVGGKFLRGLNGIGQTGKQLNKQIVKDYTQGFTQGFFKNVLVGGTGEALTEAANAVIQTYGDVRFYGDNIDKKQYISNIINAAIPAFILGGGASGVSTTINKLNQKDKSNLFKLISPNKWKNEYFASAKRVTDLAVDISQTSDPNVKKSLQKDLDNEIKRRDALSEVLNTSFDNLTNKELFKYAENLDKINNNNSILNNKKLTSTLREKAEKENLKLIQENYDILGTEYNAKDIETDQILSSALKSSETIAQRLKKFKGINREDLNFKTVENQKQIDALKNDPNFDESAEGIFIGKNKDGKAEIIINTQEASLAGATNVIGHELLHYIISRQFKTDNASMMPLISELKNYLKENHTDVFQRVQKRIDEFYTDKDGNVKEGALEEYIEVFSDLISKEKINLKDAESKGLRGEFDKILLGFGLGGGKLGLKKAEVKIETAQDLVRFIKNYTDNINRQGLLGKLMGTKILDARIISSKLVKKDDDTEIVQKKSLSANQKANIKKEVDKLGQVDKDGNNLREKGKGNFYYQAEADDIIKELRKKRTDKDLGLENEAYLDNLIASKYKVRPVPKAFVNDVFNQLIPDIRGFKPEENDSLFGYLQGRIRFRADDVYKKIYEKKGPKTTVDIGKTTKEGEVKVQVAAEQDTRTKAFEEQDISPQAEARRKAEAAKPKVEKTSKLRKALGIETGSEAYNRVLETARKVLLKAYDTGKAVRNIQIALKQEANALIFKQVKNMLGTKRNYIGNITKFRVPLINSMFTADLVQMEKKIPDNEKVFVKFVRKLTKVKDVEEAVDNNQLPKEALNVIDKGQAVNLYEKVTQIDFVEDKKGNIDKSTKENKIAKKQEDDFIAFFDQPLINPKTGARSGLRGTRKDQLTTYLTNSLTLDALMQVAQEPKVAEKRQTAAELRGETIDDTDIQVLSAAINRNPNLKFYKSSNRPNVSANLAFHLEKVFRFSSINKRVITQEDIEKYAEKLTFKVSGKGVTVGEDMSNKDKKAFENYALGVLRSDQYARVVDPQLRNELLKDFKQAIQAGKTVNQGILNEQKAVNIQSKNTPNSKVIDGNGDLYLQLFNVTYGFEIKLADAQWVSRTFNFVNGKFVPTTKNTTTDEKGDNYNDTIAELINDRLFVEINSFLQSEGVDPITNPNKITEKQREVLEPLKKGFYTSTNVSLQYALNDYVNNKYEGNNAQSGLVIEGAVHLMKTDSESYENAKIYADKFFEISGKKINDLELVDDATDIDVHISLQFTAEGINFRARPKLNADQYKKSEVNIYKNKQDSKDLGKAIFEAAKETSLKKLSKSAANTRNILKYSQTSRGMSAFDFDETLIDKGDNFIIATSPQGKEIKITSGQWPIQGSKLAEQGYTFDFKDFVNVRGGVEGPLLQKLRNRIKKYGAKNNYVLTARPPASATAIHGWLKTKGINIPLENITGLGNSTGEAKALWITGKYAEGYNDIYFVDDALPNVKAVANVIDQLDIKGKSVRAVPNIIKQKIKFSKSSLKNTINSPQYKKFRNNIKNRVLYHGGSETINTIRDNNAVWFYLDDSDAAQMWGDGEVYSVKASDIQDMVVIPDLNDVSTFTKHIQEKFNLGTKLYDVREIMLHPKADEIIKEWMEWSAKNDMEYDLGYNLYEKGKVTNGAAVTVLGVIPKNKIQQVSSKFSKSSLRGSKNVKNVLDQLDIKGKSVQAKIKFSRSVNDQFNDIIEQTTGVETEKRFSDVQANLRSRKGRYFNLVPPSAQDFMGLLYNFLGKGKVGERQFQFFKKTLVDPFARGINELNTARQRTMEKYMQLVKGLPKVKKKLTTELKKFKDIPSYIENYNVDQAIRVYLWNKNGIEVPGMTKRDTKALTDFVKNNPDIQSFADVVGAISKEQQSFTEPGEYWLTENIKSDLFSDGALGDARSKYLAEWQENVDQMFSPENMNKIKVIYGNKFVEALQDILYRMKTGRNRPTNKSRLTNEWLNWVNGSVGAIMFFNIRSAVLQTISSINYINWSDNNPLKAAAAFANQKQFWKDFSFLFNSDFLKQRRAGNQRGVNEQELSEAVTGKGAFE